MINPGGRGFSYETGRGCSSGIFVLTPKRYYTKKGVVQAFLDC